MNRTTRTIAAALAFGSLTLTACSTQAPAASDGDIGIATVHDGGSVSVELYDDTDPVQLVTKTSYSPLATFYARTLDGAAIFESLRDDLTYEDGCLATTEITLRQGDLEQIVDVRVRS